MDSEGEAMSFNKVDEALKSVGISLQTTDHQFRNFYDVIVELGEAWDTLTSSQQRYIATQFAGNRQQSRFLALVSNVDQLQENLETAQNSEDTGDLQALEALDSLESKMEQLKVSYQQFYTTMGAEDVWKSALSGIKNYIDTLNSLPKLFDTIPIGAVAMVGNLIGLIKTLLYGLLSEIANVWQTAVQSGVNQGVQTAMKGGTATGSNFIEKLINEIKNGQPRVQQAIDSTIAESTKNAANSSTVSRVSQLLGEDFAVSMQDGITTAIQGLSNGSTVGGVQLAINGYIGQLTSAKMLNASQLSQLQTIIGNISRTDGPKAIEIMSQINAVINQTGQAAEQNTSRLLNFWNALGNRSSNTFQLFQGISQSLTLIGSLMNKDTEAARGLAGTLATIGGGMQTAISIVRLMNADFTAIPQLVMGVINIINGVGIAVETNEEKLERLTKEAEELSNAAKQSKADTKTLETSIKKYEELQEKRYESAEATEEFQEAANDLGDKFPSLIQYFDESGNAIINASKAEEELAKMRQETAKATYDAAAKEVERARQEKENALEEFKKANAEVFDDNSVFLKGLEYLWNNQSDARTSLLYKYGLPTTITDRQMPNWIDFLVNNFSLFSENLPNTINAETGYREINFNDIRDNYTQWELPEEVRAVLDLILNPDSTSTYAQNRFTQQQKYVQQATDAAKVLKEQTPDDEEYITNFELFKNAVDELIKIDPERFGALAEQADLDEVIKKYDEVTSANNTLLTGQKLLANSWITASQSQLAFVKNSSGLVQILVNELDKAQQLSGREDYFTQPVASGAQEIVDRYKEFYNNLSVAEQDNLDKMLANQEKYSSQDFEQFFTDTNDATAEKRNQVVQEMQQQMVENEKKRGERLQELYKEATGLTNAPDIIIDNNVAAIKSLSILRTNISESEAELQSTLLTQAKDLKKSGFGKKATVVANTSTSIQSTLQTIDGALSNTISDIIIKNGVTTREGLQKSVEEIQSLAGQREYAEYSNQLNSIAGDLIITRDTIIENLAISVQTALNNFGDDTKKVVQILSKSRSGIGATEFDELIQQAQALGVDLNIDDFERTGGKAILKAGKYTELVQAFLEGIDNTTAEFDALTDEYGQFFDSEDDNATSFREALSDKYKNETDLADASAKVGVYLEDYKKDGDMDGAAWDAYFEAWYNALDETLKNNEYLRVLLNLQREELELTTNLQEGNYRQALGYKDSYNFSDKFLKEYYANNNTFAKGSVNAQIKNSLNKGYSDLLSDVLSKGFEHINLSDYDGLTNEADIQAAIDKAVESGDYSGFIDEYIDFTGKTIEEANALRIQALEKENQKFNVTDALKDFKYTKDGVAYASLQTLQTIADALGEDVTTLFDEATYNAALDGYQIKTDVLNSLLESVDIGQEASNLITAAQEKAKSEADTSTILSSIIDSYDKISEDNIAALANVLGWSYSQVEEQFVTISMDGTKHLNVAALRAEIESGKYQVFQAVLYQMLEVTDSTISSITDIIGSRSKGFTDSAQMISALNEVNKYQEEAMSFDDMYEWDDTLGAFILTRQGLIAQISTLYQQLPTLSAEEAKIAQELITESVEDVAKEINTVDFVTADKDSKTYQEFQTAIQNYLDVVDALGTGNGFILDGWLQLDTEHISSVLRNGGENAVKMAEAIAQAADQELSTEDIQTIYRGEAARLTNAYEHLTAGPGEIIDSTTQEIFEAVGIATEQLGESGQYVVTGVNNLTDAYRVYLERLRATGTATLSEINAAAAQVLSNRNGNQAEQQAIEALGDATNMTYERFGEILARGGIELSETLVNDLEDAGIIDYLGGNKMRIADFSAFAEIMNWSPDSEEYVSAFKTYNDSMIELNRKTEKNILEEVQKLGDAKLGDQINLTQLSAKLSETLIGKRWNKNIGKNIDFTAEGALVEKLSALGAQLEDGILTLGGDANIPAIIQTIASYAQQYGELLREDMAALADTLNNVLKNFTDAIANGLSGKLSNSDAFGLQQMADSLGINVEAQFIKTAEGLKLTRDSAIELYTELQKIDGLAADRMFDSLAESITGDLGSGADNMADTMAIITELQNKIKENQTEITELNNNLARGIRTEGDEARLSLLQQQNAELEQQIDLYGQIAQRQMSDPDSYDFMSGKLPNYLQGPVNYWDSVGSAYKTMNEAASSGYMDFTDFYNIINEMSNLAAASGSLKTAGLQIAGNADAFKNSTDMLTYILEASADSLTNIDGEGLKVSMSNLGIDFLGGAESMQGNFQAGIKVFAQSQIDMIDAAIQMLETIVAMEELGNIDVDNNGIFNISDIFEDSGITDNGDFTKDYQTWAKQLIDLADTDDDLKTALESIKFNGQTIYDMVKAGFDPETWEKIGMTEKEYAQVMEGLVKAFQSGDYDLENLTESVWDIINQTMPDGMTVDIGNKTIYLTGGTSYTIDWESKDVKDVLDDLQGTEEDKKRQVINSIKHWNEGTLGQDENDLTIEQVLQVQQVFTISTDDKGNETYIVNGKKYKDKNEALAQAALATQTTTGHVSNTTTTTTTNKETGTEDTTVTQEITWGGFKYTYSSISGNTTTREFTEGAAQVLRGKSDQLQEAIKTSLEGNNFEDGKLIVPFNGVELKLDAGGSTNASDYTSLGEDALIEAMGLSGLVAAISKAVTEAFGKEEFTSAITTAINTAFGSAFSGTGDNSEMLTAASETGKQIPAKIALGIRENVGILKAMITALGPIIQSTLTEVVSGLNLASFEITDLTASLVELTIDSIDSSHYDHTLTLTEDIAQGEANITNLSVGATNMTPNANLAALQTMDFSTTSQSLGGIATKVGNINRASFSNFSDLQTLLGGIKEQVETIWSIIQNFANQTFTVELKYSGSGPDNGGGADTGGTATPNVDFTGVLTSIGTVTGAMGQLADAVSSIPDKATEVNKTAHAMDGLHDKSTEVGHTAKAIDSLKSKDVSVTGTVTGYVNAVINVKVKTDQGATAETDIRLTKTGTATKAKGDVALAKGTALASGSKETLMGELGPELVVSNGHYYLVGESGPEMVNLADDAIVFNHQQTEDLLKHGNTKKRGTPSTNEKNAISFATGNATGPAMASASQALAALKQLRAMWESLRDASAKDLGSQAGRGAGGGGGGGGGGEDDFVEQQNVIEDIQRWYNLLRQIEKIEEQISYQETLQNKIQSDRVANGFDLYDSYKKQLNLLDEEIKRNKELAAIQKDWYEKKRQELAASDYGMIFTYDDEGLQQYVDGPNRGLDILETLTQRDVNGKAVGAAETAAKQLEYLRSVGFDISKLSYNDDGTLAATYNADKNKFYGANGKELKGQDLADAQAAMMENFWNAVDGWRDELDSLYDSYNEQEEKVLENQTQQNEILQKLVDNQISIEEDLVKAIEAREQAEIDRLTDEKDALQESTDKFIDGLNEQLNREQDMYKKTQDNQELTKLQRQLAILQRSGGSASQIRSLQEQIDSQQQDMYFQKQQEQIDAVKEASDKQIERLDAQIDLMTETLEYQKENGLLWAEVRDIMQNMSAEEVMNLLQQWDPDYISQSELQISEDLRDFKMRFELWAGEREDEELDKILKPIHQQQEERYAAAGVHMSSSAKNNARDAYMEEYKKTGSASAAEAAAKASYDKYYNEQVTAQNEAKADYERASHGTITIIKKKSVPIYANAGDTTKVSSFKPSSDTVKPVYDYATIGNDIWVQIDEGWVKIKSRKSDTDDFKENAGFKNIKPYKASTFASGGYTGSWGKTGKLAMLHEKELVLNKDDTQNMLEAIKQLREYYNVFKSSQMETWQNEFDAMFAKAATISTPTYTNEGTGDTIVIEEANVNMEIKRMNNDYDARRAGEAALDEIVKIARKTSTRSVPRR